MRTTDLLLSVGVLVPLVLVATVVFLRRGLHVLFASYLTLAVLLVLTLIFDSVIVGSKIVAYNPDHILGIRIGFAPIEDFAYPIAAAFGLPALWVILPRLMRKAPPADPPR